MSQMTEAQRVESAIYRCETTLYLSNLPKTWLIDIDGTIVHHNGYKLDSCDTLLEGVSEFFASLPKGDKVILLTARSKSEVANLKAFLTIHKIRFDEIISDLPFGERILINDTKPSGLKTAFAINKVRDEKFDIKVEIDEKI
ncbi:hypothetical protein [Helicobacter sp. T3_23-1059]